MHLKNDYLETSSDLWNINDQHYIEHLYKIKKLVFCSIYISFFPISPEATNCIVLKLFIYLMSTAFVLFIVYVITIGL